MRKLVGILLTVAAIIAFNCSALEQEMKGKVTDSSGAAVNGATVTLYAAAENLTALNDKGIVDLSKLKSKAEVTTGSDGSWSSKVTVGAYFVKVTASCYSEVMKGLSADRKVTENDAVTAPGTIDVTLAGGCTAAAPTGAAPAAATATGTTGGWTITVKDSAGTTVTGTTEAGASSGATGVASITLAYTGTLTNTPVLVTDVKIASSTTGFTRTLQAVKMSSGSATAKYVIPKASTVCFSAGEATDPGTASTLSNESSEKKCIKDSSGTTTTTDNIIAIMSWDSDGTDVDLHALDLVSQSKIYWGALSVTGMGTLDLDNVSGYGPETIVITSSNNTKFGAHAWSVSKATNVTLRVICPNGNYDQSFKKTDWASDGSHSGKWIIFGTWSKTGAAS